MRIKYYSLTSLIPKTSIFSYAIYSVGLPGLFPVLKLDKSQDTLATELCTPKTMVLHYVYGSVQI